MSASDSWRQELMSSEIIPMLSRTSVKDVKHHLARAPSGEAGDMLRLAYADRLSTAKYLADNFGHGVPLLESMSRHRAYISGSRSLEFFKPGHLGPDSDWDFYLPRDPHTVCSFMHSLSEMGVFWQSSINKLQACISNGNGKVLFAGLQYSHHYNRGDLQSLATRYGVSSAGLIDLPFQLPSPDSVGQPEYTGSWITVSVVDQGLGLQAKPWEPEDGEDLREEMYRHIGSVINGHIIRPEGAVKVQLILEDRHRGFDCPAVMHYHSSCVQSVISPHLACHFYGDLASGLRSYGWRPDRRSKEAQEKYKGRGFRYLPLERNHFKIRTACDADAIVVLRESATEAYARVIEFYQAAVQNMCWQELSYDVHQLPNPSDGNMWFLQDDERRWFARRCDANIFEDLIQKGVLPCLIAAANTAIVLF